MNNNNSSGGGSGVGGEGNSSIKFIFLTAVIVSIMSSVIIMNRGIASSSPTNINAAVDATNWGREEKKWNSFVGEEDGEEEVVGRRIVVETNNDNDNDNDKNSKIKKERQTTIERTNINNEKKSKSKKAVATTENNSNEKNTKGRKDEKAATKIELDDEDADDGCGIGTIPENVDNDSDITSTTTITSIKKGSNIQLPLRPPYYLLQNGLPRSGSTFQAQLLMAIIDLKSSSSSTDGRGSNSAVLFRNSPNPNMRHQQRANKALKGKEKEKDRTNQIYQGKEFFQQIVKHGFLQKSHESVWIEKTLCELEKVDQITDNKNRNTNHIAVFTSVVDIDVDVKENNNGNSINSRNNNDMNQMKKYQIQYNQGYIAHTQVMKSTEFQNCSLCEIKNYYQPIFDLSSKEVHILENYMSKYQLLRKCCGTQMSKYNRLRLHGCNVKQYQHDKQHIYPWCENHNMTQIEMEFELLLKENGLQYRSVSGEEVTGTGGTGSDGGWKVGECQKVDEKIRQGIDFNGAIFDGNCSLNSVDTTQKDFFKRTQKARQEKKKKEEGKRNTITRTKMK